MMGKFFMESISNTVKVGIFLSLLINLSACTMADINSAEPIAIPKGLSKQEVKLAILSAFYPDQAPREWTQGYQVTDSTLMKYFDYSHSSNKRGGWYVDGIGPSSIFFAINGEDVMYSRSLRVEYFIDGNRIVQRIGSSDGLHQSRSSIHKLAFKWLGNLEYKTKGGLEKFSAMKKTASEN